jgi:hypothetical protein
MSDHLASAMLHLLLFVGACALECKACEQILTKDQAIAFAKKKVADTQYTIKDSGFTSGQDYITAIERNPDCCRANHGERLLDGSGAGWSVTLSAMHLPSKYEHIVEFDRCGRISYYGAWILK